MRKLAALTIAWTLGAVAIVQLASVPNASAIEGLDMQLRPSRWAPTGLYAQVNQDAEWGNFAYHMNWGGPSSSHSLGPPRDDHGTFEVGWKETGRKCDSAAGGVFGKAGFPPEIEAQVDWTEDDNDAVLWVADMDMLAFVSARIHPLGTAPGGLVKAMNSLIRGLDRLYGTKLDIGSA